MPQLFIYAIFTEQNVSFKETKTQAKKLGDIVNGFINKEEFAFKCLRNSFERDNYAMILMHPLAFKIQNFTANPSNNISYFMSVGVFVPKTIDILD